MGVRVAVGTNKHETENVIPTPLRPGLERAEHYDLELVNDSEAKELGAELRR